jgi:hypothetical protein
VFPQKKKRARENAGFLAVSKNPVATGLNTGLRPGLRPLFLSKNTYDFRRKIYATNGG